MRSAATPVGVRASHCSRRLCHRSTEGQRGQHTLSSAGVATDDEQAAQKAYEAAAVAAAEAEATLKLADAARTKAAAKRVDGREA